MSEQTIYIPDDVTSVTMNVTHHIDRVSIQMTISTTMQTLNLDVNMPARQFAFAMQKIGRLYRVVKLPTIHFIREVYQVYPR